MRRKSRHGQVFIAAALNFAISATSSINVHAGHGIYTCNNMLYINVLTAVCENVPMYMYMYLVLSVSELSMCVNLECK